MSSFELGAFHFYLFTALGSALLWCKLEKQKTRRRVFGFSEIVERCIHNEKARVILEPFVFIAVVTLPLWLNPA
jgi:hypothetical protein